LASFQHAVIHELLTRAAAAAESIGARGLIVSGGVACNSGLRAAARAAKLPYPVHFPSAGLATDNAAMIAADGRPVWIRESGDVLIENDQPTAVRGIFQDVTEQKLAAVKLDKLNKQLVDTSRQAGMAEVATGVLHNVGNVLNSVNVSATLIREKLRRSEMAVSSSSAACSSSMRPIGPLSSRPIPRA